MYNSSSRKKKWVLTKEAFDILLVHIDPDTEESGEKFLRLQRKLVRFFEWRDCFDPEALADETFNRVARKLDEGQEVGSVENYCFGVARNVFREEIKKRKKEQEAVDRAALEDEPHNRGPEDDPQSEARLKCFETCLGDLPRQDRDVITRYYQGEKHEKIENRRRLAEDLGIAPNALRIRTHRIRDRLERCVMNCLRGLSPGRNELEELPL